MLETSESTAKLDEALAKAQGEIEAASKDSVNPHFKSKYADLTAVWSAIRPALSKHGIAVTQWLLHSDDARLHIITRVAHAGEWLRCEFSIPVGKLDAHGYGSAVTYAKRYSLAAAIGVVADDDDDGNAATGSGIAKPPPKKAYDKNGIVVDAYAKLQKDMRTIEQMGTVEDLALYWKENQKTIINLPADWFQEIELLKDEVKGVLQSKLLGAG
jgi:hypothetical protein